MLCTVACVIEGIDEMLMNSVAFVSMHIRLHSWWLVCVLGWELACTLFQCLMLGVL